MKLFDALFGRKEKADSKPMQQEEKATAKVDSPAPQQPAAQPFYSLADNFERLRKLSEAHPDDTALLIQMAHIAFQLKDYVAMQDACEKAIIIDNHLLEAYHLYAQACTSQNDMVNAIAMATKAIMLLENEASPYAKASDLYLLHGRLLMQMGDKAGAEEDMKKAWQLNPDSLTSVSGTFEAEGKD